MINGISIFHVLIYHLCTVLGEVFVQIFCSFFIYVFTSLTKLIREIATDTRSERYTSLKLRQEIENVKALYF